MGSMMVCKDIFKIVQMVNSRGHWARDIGQDLMMIQIVQCIVIVHLLLYTIFQVQLLPCDNFPIVARQYYVTSCHVILSYHNGEIEVPSIQASVGMLIYVFGFPAV